jgi:hypothetical protein
MSITNIPEIIVPGKRLGRHVDDRVALHRAAGGPPPMAPAIVSVTHASSGLPLNQGDTGSCTAHALGGALNTVPHWHKGNPTVGEPLVYDIYSREEQALGFGVYPPNDDGGSGMAVCEAAIELKVCCDYQSTTDVDEALRALVIRPVITGINWYTSMDNPSPSGLVDIAPDATVRGGHEICAIAIDTPNELVWFVNSWGTSYGVAHGDIPGGCFCMAFSTWETLLGQQGDVTVPRTSQGWKA